VLRRIYTSLVAMNFIEQSFLYTPTPVVCRRARHLVIYYARLLYIRVHYVHCTLQCTNVYNTCIKRAHNTSRSKVVVNTDAIYNMSLSHIYIYVCRIYNTIRQRVKKTSPPYVFNFFFFFWMCCLYNYFYCYNILFVT